MFLHPRILVNRPFVFYENICYSCCKGTLSRVFLFIRLISSPKLKSDEIFVVCPFIFLTAFFVAIFLCSQPFTLNLNHTGKCTVEMFFAMFIIIPKETVFPSLVVDHYFLFWALTRHFSIPGSAESLGDESFRGTFLGDF